MEYSVSSLAFPPLPQHLSGAFAGDALRLRRFGSSTRDLDIDFALPLPHLVSELIACCTLTPDGRDLDRALAGELEVSARIVCLLRLAELEGVESLSAVFTCPV